MENIYNFLLKNLGLILNLIGTVLIAISFGRYPKKEAAPHTFDGKGGKKYIAYFNYPKLFCFGLILLFFGFVFQLK